MLAYYLVTTLHVIVCFILILVVLLQSGKSADIAGAFGGGGSQTAFGSRGPASFLSKLTTAAAIVFMLTCLSLSLMGTKTEAKSVMDTTKTKAAPVSKAPAATKSTAPAPTPDEIRRQQEEIERRLQQAQPAPQQAPAGTPNVTVVPGKTTTVQQPQAKPEAAKETKPPTPKKQ
jgi:preprotein translocase subunit SecG